MYNRYIPRDDGSYSRNRMVEPNTSTLPEPPRPTNQQEHTRQEHIPHHTNNNPGIFDFFRNLLPRKMETADLIVLLLLLLMAGERQEDQNDALLTMALYFLI